MTEQSKSETVGYVPGAFDMFHVGHLNILRRSREMCDWLVAGVATDKSVEVMKGYRPIVPEFERAEVVASNRYVDEVVIDHSEDKRQAWEGRHFDILFKGSDWRDTEKGDRLEKAMAEIGVRVEYLPYTPQTSSTQLRQALNRIAKAL